MRQNNIRNSFAATAVQHMQSHLMMVPRTTTTTTGGAAPVNAGTGITGATGSELAAGTGNGNGNGMDNDNMATTTGTAALAGFDRRALDATAPRPLLATFAALATLTRAATAPQLLALTLGGVVDKAVAVLRDSLAAAATNAASGTTGKNTGDDAGAEADRVVALALEWLHGDDTTAIKGADDDHAHVAAAANAAANADRATHAALASAALQTLAIIVVRGNMVVRRECARRGAAGISVALLRGYLQSVDRATADAAAAAATTAAANANAATVDSQAAKKRKRVDSGAGTAVPESVHDLAAAGAGAANANAAAVMGQQMPVVSVSDDDEDDSATEMARPAKLMRFGSLAASVAAAPLMRMPKVAAKFNANGNGNTANNGGDSMLGFPATPSSVLARISSPPPPPRSPSPSPQPPTVTLSSSSSSSAMAPGHASRFFTPTMRTFTPTTGTTTTPTTTTTTATTTTTPTTALALGAAPLRIRPVPRIQDTIPTTTATPTTTAPLSRATDAVLGLKVLLALGSLPAVRAHLRQPSAAGAPCAYAVMEPLARAAGAPATVRDLARTVLLQATATPVTSAPAASSDHDHGCDKDDHHHGGVVATQTPVTFQCANLGCSHTEPAPNSFARCARCRTVRYCSRECQVSAWTQGHRYWCASSSTAAVVANKPTEESEQEARRRSEERTTVAAATTTSSSVATDAAWRWRNEQRDRRISDLMATAPTTTTLPTSVPVPRVSVPVVVPSRVVPSVLLGGGGAVIGGGGVQQQQPMVACAVEAMMAQRAPMMMPMQAAATSAPHPVALYWYQQQQMLFQQYQQQQQQQHQAARQ
ncbi:hypothetical protein BC828DRAFT_393283 [Blastocladiella britannica]|nr:hypothetical protein BC828DRAFT_393283 [Blastocladiella britannica]